MKRVNLARELESLRKLRRHIAQVCSEIAICLQLRIFEDGNTRLLQDVCEAVAQAGIEAYQALAIAEELLRDSIQEDEH
jgi:hypothetical protein